MLPLSHFFFFFFFNDTATTEIYTLSLHDALPICALLALTALAVSPFFVIVGHLNLLDGGFTFWLTAAVLALRSEEHTSELQSRLHLVCRLLLEKKKKNQHVYTTEGRTNIQVCYLV